MSSKLIQRSRYELQSVSSRVCSFQKALLHQSTRQRYKTSCPRDPRQTFRQPKRASLSPSLLLVTAVLGAITVYQLSSTAEKTVVVQNQTDRTCGYFANSTCRDGKMPTIPPGRPETLTPDEEEKLKEFWGATLNVFGVHSPSLPTSANGDASKIPVEGTIAENQPLTTVGTGRDRASTVGSEKKKKKRMSFFSQKQKDTDEDVPEEESNGTTHVSHDHEDKYGQTKDFKLALASQSPADLRKAFWSMVKHDNPDGLLLRFLRARKWDVEKALVMMVSTMHWRSQEMHVDDDVIKNGEGGALEASRATDSIVRREGEDFLAQERLGKSFLHGMDKEGRPICFVRVRLHRQGEQSESSLERYTVFVIETARLLLATPVDTAAIVFDMTGFSRANMDYGPVKFMIKCFEANYPESLGVVLVHKAPWIFQGIWNIIKGWLDPVVASKVHFTKSVEELENYIPRGQIIKELGGDEDWTYHFQEPKDEENQKMNDSTARDFILEQRDQMVEEFEKVTIAWLGGEKESIDTLKKQRADISEKLRKNYWQLDPYLRARTIYDRIGVINEGGIINFYPQVLSNTPEINHSATKASESHPDDVD